MARSTSLLVGQVRVGLIVAKSDVEARRVLLDPGVPRAVRLSRWHLVHSTLAAVCTIILGLRSWRKSEAAIEKAVAQILGT